MKNILLAVMLSTVAVGCASYGNKVDRNYAQSLEKGVTTEKQVRENLGNPHTVQTDSNGNRTLIYMHTKAQAKAISFVPIVGAFAGGSDVETTMLHVMVSKEGIVKDWNYSQSNSEVNTGVMAN